MYGAEVIVAIRMLNWYSHLPANQRFKKDLLDIIKADAHFKFRHEHLQNIQGRPPIHEVI
jgi:hypothetical protein